MARKGKAHKSIERSGSSSSSSGSDSDESNNRHSRRHQEQKAESDGLLQAAGLRTDGDEESAVSRRAPEHADRGLPGLSERPMRDRGSSNEDTDSSAVDSSDDEREGDYKFDPITEYMMKQGRQDAQMEKAWDFYAKFTLPTYVHKEGSDDPNDFRLQEPGEEGGMLYSLWGTPLKQLGDFGLGMGLYFQTLAVMGTVFLVAGLINTWSIYFFRSDDYSGGQDKLDEQISKGSAACTLRQVVCTDATCNAWTTARRPCMYNLEIGLIDFGTTVLLFVVLLSLGRVQDRWAKKIDEDEQTSADYSIMVKDPGPSYTRPGTWRRFFQRRFGHVTYVTVAVKCGKLMRLLAKRYTILQKIRVEAQGGQEEEDIAKDPKAVMSREQWPAPCWKLFLMKFGLATDVVFWHEKLVAVSREIDRLRGAKQATKVFVTFEKEVSQRECLKAMTTGYLVARKDEPVEDKEDLVLNGNVLSVSEAPEPGEIIWQNLQYGMNRRYAEIVGRLIFTAFLVVLAGVLVWALKEAHATAAAAFIAINNTLLPAIIKWITLHPKGGEHHHTNSSYQTSLMLKIIIAQWMNTAFIIYIINDIHNAPDEEYISQISKILWADAFTQPLLKVLDIKTRFLQYVVSPFSKTQAKMNTYFLGTPVFMAERYASLLKTMFVCLFFSAIFPQGYYVAAMAMFMTYWSSKYCLFNRWKTPEPIDDSLTITTRRYLAVALVIHILVSLQYYAGWPFDDICPTRETVTEAFTDISLADGRDTASYTIIDEYPEVGDPVWHSCSKDHPDIWEEKIRYWMTDDQETIVWLFRVFGIVMTALVGLSLFGGTVYTFIRRLFKGVYKPVGRATGVGFSEVEQINAYVPEMKMKKVARTLLATDLSNVNRHHISWTGDHEAYNICSPDAFPGMSRAERSRLLSRVVYYPPSEDADRNMPTPTRMRGIPL